MEFLLTFLGKLSDADQLASKDLLHCKLLQDAEDTENHCGADSNAGGATLSWGSHQSHSSEKEDEEVIKDSKTDTSEYSLLHK